MASLGLRGEKPFPSAEEIDEIDDPFSAIDLLEEHKIPYEGLEDVEELKERLILEHMRRNNEPTKPAVVKMDAKLPPLRKTYIDRLEGVFEAYDVCNKYDINTDGCDSVDEIKERMRTHYWMLQHGQYKHKIGNAILKAGQEDVRKRQRLIGMFQDLKRIIQDKDESRKQEIVEEFLSIEGTTNDIIRDCDTRMDDLEDGDCVILVAGESSSGKSSCINLLCGEDVLPVHSGCCSSTVVTIRYGDTRSARILYTTPGKPDLVLPDLEGDGMKAFQDIAFMRNTQREEGHDVKEIQLFLPVWFLKSGLVIADTPGIGENTFLEEYLMSYIANNHILGFVYIIMSDLSGGVQEDRLLNLLKLIMEEQKKEHKLIPFDPKATLFVCNRFDAIQEESRQMVKDHILRKLDKYYPEFDESQAVFFSAKKSQLEVNVHPDYINVNYRALLHAMQKLFSDSMDRRIKSSYKWIENVLRRMVHLFKSTVIQLDRSEKDRLRKTFTIKAKVSNLKQKADDVIKRLRTNVETKIQEIVNEVHDYLKRPQARFTLCSSWGEGEIPNIEEMDNAEEKSEWIRDKVDTAFYNRFCHFLESWELEEGKILDIESEVIADVKQELGILEDDIIQVESDMQNDRISLSGSRGENGRRLSFALQPGSTIDVSPKLALQLSGRVKQKSMLQKMKHKQSCKKMLRDPAAWARKRSEKLLDKLIKNKPTDGELGVLDQFIRQLMQRPLEYIDKVNEKIPKMIQADQDLLEKIEQLCQTERQHRSKYEHMMESVESLRRCLMDYGEGYIFVNDFKSNEVKILHQVLGGESFAKTFQPNFSKMITNSSGQDLASQSFLPQGLWTTVYHGLLDRDQTQSKISIKFYLRSSGVENTFQEVAKLRCLTTMDMPLAEFLGIHHAESQTPTFIYSGHLLPIGRYVQQTDDKKGTIPRVLRETADGLSYLHTKGLVHMELTATTLTVDDEGNVKLSGACIPRRATMPNETEHPVADFVYLAPEVLNRELYIAPADVYGFGLLVYELISEQKPFKRERKISFSEFVAKVNPEQMLSLNDEQSEQNLQMRHRNLIRDCVNLDPQERPKMAAITEILARHQKLRQSIRLPTPVTPVDVFKRSKKHTLH